MMEKIPNDGMRLNPGYNCSIHYIENYLTKYFNLIKHKINILLNKFLYSLQIKAKLSPFQFNYQAVKFH